MIVGRFAEVVAVLVVVVLAAISIAKVSARIWIDAHRQASEEDLARIKFEKQFKDLDKS